LLNTRSASAEDTEGRQLSRSAYFYTVWPQTVTLPNYQKIVPRRIKAYQRDYISLSD